MKTAREGLQIALQLSAASIMKLGSCKGNDVKCFIKYILSIILLKVLCFINTNYLIPHNGELLISFRNKTTANK